MQYFVEPTSENPKYRCGTCKLNVNKSQKAIQCDNCNYWNHIKCDKIDSNVCATLKNSKEHYICNLCKEEIIPFHKLSNQQFFTTIALSKRKDSDENSDLKIFPMPALKSLEVYKAGKLESWNPFSSKL